jgi:hypothetical protein
MNPTGKGGLKERPHQINRKGRPKKGDSLLDILEYELDQAKTAETGGEKKKVLYRHSIVRKIIELADKGDFQALKYIFDRTLGTPRQSIDANVMRNMNITIGSPPDLEDADFPE